MRQRYKEARLQEDAAKWNVEAEKLKARRDGMVAELIRIFPVELIRQIVEKLTAMREFDKTISAHNHRLYEMQLRGGGDGCRSVPNATPAFAQELKIPDMEKPPGYFLWPPPYDPTPMLNMIRPDPFVGAYVADGTYARLDDERRHAAEKRRIEEAERRAREFESMQGDIREVVFEFERSRSDRAARSPQGLSSSPRRAHNPNPRGFPTTKGLQLPDFVDSQRLVYPPPEPDHMAMAMYEAAAAHARRLGTGCNADWWQAKTAEAAEQRQQAERLAAESERKQAESKRAYEEALLAADEARRTGRRRG